MTRSDVRRFACCSNISWTLGRASMPISAKDGYQETHGRTGEELSRATRPRSHQLSTWRPQTTAFAVEDMLGPVWLTVLSPFRIPPRPCLVAALLVPTFCHHHRLVQRLPRWDGAMLRASMTMPRVNSTRSFDALISKSFGKRAHPCAPMVAGGVSPEARGCAFRNSLYILLSQVWVAAYVRGSTRSKAHDLPCTTTCKFLSSIRHS